MSGTSSKKKNRNKRCNRLATHVFLFSAKNRIYKQNTYTHKYTHTPPPPPHTHTHTKHHTHKQSLANEPRLAQPLPLPTMWAILHQRILERVGIACSNFSCKICTLEIRVSQTLAKLSVPLKLNLLDGVGDIYWAYSFHVRVRNLGYARAFHSLSARSNSWLNLIVLRRFGYSCRIKLLTLVDAKMAPPASKHKRAGSARNWIWLNSAWPQWWISCSVIRRLSVIGYEDSNFDPSFVTVTTVVLLLVKLSVVHSL